MAVFYLMGLAASLVGFIWVSTLIQDIGGLVGWLFFILGTEAAIKFINEKFGKKTRATNVGIVIVSIIIYILIYILCKNYIISMTGIQQK